MSETTHTSETPTDETTDNATDEQGKPADDALGDAGKKALDTMKAERNKAARKAAELEARLKEFEDRDKSEAEKLAERVTGAESRAQEAQNRADRLEIALEKGLTPSQAKRLVGSTREELESDADELIRDLGDAAKPRQPKPDPAQGRVPNGTPLDPRAADLAQIEADLKAAPRR